MLNRFADRIRQGSRRIPQALAVFALLAVATGVLYRQALAVGVLSDGWVLLEIGSRGFRRAPFVLLSYHTIPVTNLFMALLWKLFGLHEMRYQAANLAGLTLVSWLLYETGCALFRQARVALLAAFLFLANSSFYEVPFWPTVGNFQSLAALLYLSALLALMRSYRSSHPQAWRVLFSLCGVAAFFTYEPAVSVLGVGAAYAFLAPGAEGALPLRERLRRALAVIAAALPAIVLVLGSKLYTASLGYHALFLPHDWPGLKLRLYLLVRGCIAIFTLSGGDGRIYRFLTLGLLPAGGSPLYNVLLAAWIVGLPIGGALLAWRTRSPAVRFAVVWFAAHMLIVATATDIVSRHFYLGALPASLLLSWGIWRGADRLGDWTARRPGFAALGVTREQAAGLLAGIALTLLAAHAATDLATAAALHREASAASRQVVALVRQRLAEEPGAPPPRVALVNMPAILARDGIGAFAFVNGLGAALWLATRQRIAEPDLFYTYAAFADGKFANVSRPITLAELGARVRDPKSQVLMFDARTHTVVELDRTAWRAPEGYDPASAPYLEWQTGDWPWFRAYAAQPLELPLAVSPQRSWVAVRYLRAPGVAFTVTDAAGRRLEEVRAPAGVRPAWPLAVFPLAGPSVEAADLTLRPTTEVWLAGVRSFSPPADYTPESAPFLPWASRPVLQFQVEAPLQLPLSTPGCESRPCSLRLDVLAGPGRSFALTAGGTSLVFADAAVPGWRGVRLPLPAGSSAVVRLEPRGSLPILVSHLGWEAAGSGH